MCTSLKTAGSWWPQEQSDELGELGGGDEEWSLTFGMEYYDQKSYLEMPGSNQRCGTGVEVGCAGL